jgi:hypothetical protein
MITEQTVQDQFDWEGIRKDLDKADWEDDLDNRGQQVRREFLGSWAALSPSGKTYAPFANSNVAGCDGCNGEGTTKSKYKCRLLTKWKNRNKVRKKWIKLYGNPTEWPPLIKAKSDKLNRLQLRKNPTCWRCGGCGSAEAHDDEVWREFMEEALEKIGAFYDESDGDIFASEVRDAPDKEVRYGCIIDGESVCADCLDDEDPSEDPDSSGFVGTAFLPEEDFECSRCEGGFTMPKELDSNA